jgi:protein-S-isoprenylcysteine O-methyltransferase Ste14
MHPTIITASQFAAAGAWLLLCVVWLVAAFGAKRNVISRPWWFRMPVRIALLAILVLIFARRAGRGFLLPGAAAAVLLDSPGVALAGAAICVSGIGFALWARAVIGTNWGMPMTLKQDHELVVTGPYAWVRHPIYSGILFAMAGSALVLSLWWILILVLNGAQFVYAAKKEEQLMLSQFPEQYPAYMRRTRMLIPFVL